MSREDEVSKVEEVIRQRIECVKLRKPDVIRDVMGVELYSKFDDWPPGMRLRGEEALRSEADALKVLDEYRYSLSDFVVNVVGDVAWASFYLDYDGVIRGRSFEVKSRVSMVLVRSESRWRIVQEHFSMFPVTVPSLAPKPSKQEVKVSEERRDGVEEAVLKVLGDGVERSVAEITEEVSKILGREVVASQVVEKCRLLVSKGVVKTRGRFYPRFKISSPSS